MSERYGDTIPELRQRNEQQAERYEAGAAVVRRLVHGRLLAEQGTAERLAAKPSAHARPRKSPISG